METNVEQKVKGRVIRRKYNTRNASNANIPEEIQIDILSRLPPKSLSRCKCVSEHWNDTITIQAFLLKHSRSYDKHPKLAFVERSTCWGKGSVISYELDGDNTPKTITTVANKKTTTSRIRGQDVYFTDFSIPNYYVMSNICNDLICLFNPFSTCVGLLNIRTGDFIRLPAITTAITIKPVGRFRFWYALGFDPVQKVFKVLCSIYPNRSKKCTTKVAILTVGSKYWNPIDLNSVPSSLIENLSLRSITNSICLNGVIYWVHQNRTTSVIVLTVAAFDLNREAFSDNELVRTICHTTYRRYYLTCLKECPTLFIWKRQYNETDAVEQWTLNHKNPNPAWEKRYVTNNFPIVVPFEAHTATVAGGSTLLQHSELINSEYSWYVFYDLEKFVTE